ncbi:PREDICTED: uncharacterized protein LOC109473878 [Branchiostoma belcheri]|uniref:Uncharacterized protein LOC109473878 n=1 Tax=Branchiostoma belcheri TaxID=7741 RepID=A0A6P4Z6K8_BRABE|nr:PREDICTED: uncharacterized protein LOC109473878 [Branchiostoma belcheri]
MLCFQESEEDGVDFIGRSALLKQKQEGVRQKFVMFLLDNHDLENDLWPWGGGANLGGWKGRWQDDVSRLWIHSEETGLPWFCAQPRPTDRRTSGHHHQLHHQEQVRDPNSREEVQRCSTVVPTTNVN